MSSLICMYFWDFGDLGGDWKGFWGFGGSFGWIFVDLGEIWGDWGLLERSGCPGVLVGFVLAVLVAWLGLAGCPGVLGLAGASWLALLRQSIQRPLKHSAAEYVPMTDRWGGFGATWNTSRGQDAGWAVAGRRKDGTRARGKEGWREGRMQRKEGGWEGWTEGGLPCST